MVIKRATLKDIAREAGVGSATVDRVLNERGNVSVEVAERVLAAARSLNIRRVLPARYRRTLRVEILLARPELPLIERMGSEFAKLSHRVDRSVIIQRTRLKTDAPELMAGHIERAQADGIVLYAQSHPAIEMAIDRATASGKAVVTMISDIPRSAPARLSGIDNAAAGRTAAFLIGRMVAGGGHLSCSATTSRSSRTRRASAASSPRSIGRRGASRSRSSRAEMTTTSRSGGCGRRWRGQPDTVAIYNAGAANRAVAGALADRATGGGWFSSGTS